MMFKTRLTSTALLCATLFIAGCNTTKPPETIDGYDAVIYRKTSGAAARSSIAKICGATRIGQYRNAFITKMKAEHSITPRTETKLRAFFRDSDNRTSKNFKDKESREKNCKNIPTHQGIIDRGIKGNFSGQF